MPRAAAAHCFLLVPFLAIAAARAVAQDTAPANPPETASGQRFDTDAAYARAIADLRAGRHEAAAEQFAILVERDPRNVDWLLGRGQSLLALGRPSEAVPVLEKARSLAPAYEDVWRAELNALEASDQPRRAEALLEQAQRQFPQAQWPVTRRAALRERELLRSGTRLSFNAGYEHLSRNRGEWRTLALDINHPLQPNLRLLGGLHGEERFGEKDGQVAAGIVSRFGDWVTVLSGDIAPGAVVLPQSSVQLEIGRPVTRRVSLGLRARHAHHETVDVDTIAGTIEAAVAAFTVAYSLVATQPTDLDFSYGHNLRIAREYGNGSRISVVLSHGEEAETVAPGQVLVTQVDAIALTGLHWLSAAWGWSWEVGYHEQGDLYNRSRVRLGLEHRF
jgi:YaiO family outer membrane protein